MCSLKKYDDFLIWLTLYDSNFACREIFGNSYTALQTYSRGVLLCPIMSYYVLGWGILSGGLCPVPIQVVSTCVPCRRLHVFTRIRE